MGGPSGGKGDEGAPRLTSQDALDTSDDERIRPAAAGQLNTRIQNRSIELSNYADHSMSRDQARTAAREDLQAIATTEGRSRQTALGTIGRIAESQQAYREGLQQANPGVASEALSEARRQRSRITQSQSEFRASPEGIAAAPQAGRMHIEVALAEAKHDQWRAGRSYADMRPLAEPGTPLTKDERKQAEYGRMQNDGATDIVARHATLKGLGMDMKDLSVLQTERIAREDSHALALLKGHPREPEAAALVLTGLQTPAYRSAFEKAQAEMNWSEGIRSEVSLVQAIQLRSEDEASRPGGMRGVAEPQARQLAAMDAADTRKISGPEQRDKARDAAPSNAMRSVGDTAAKRPAHPPLEDRFNIKAGLLATEYRFRDQAGKVAFTEKMFGLHTTTDSAAAIKAMVDRAAERGWATVSLKGSSEFVRQGWIAANAHGLKAVGHTPTQADRDTADKDRARLRAGRNGEGSRQQHEVAAGAQLERGERADRACAAAGPIEQRQLAAAIERALVDAKVSPEIRGQVRDMMAAEGARRIARGERFKVPVYDARAPRARTRSTDPGPQRLGDRERSR